MQELVFDLLGPVVNKEGDPGLTKVRLRLHSDRQELIVQRALGARIPTRGFSSRLDFQGVLLAWKAIVTFNLHDVFDGDVVVKIIHLLLLGCCIDVVRVREKVDRNLCEHLLVPVKEHLISDFVTVREVEIWVSHEVLGGRVKEAYF